MICKFCGNESAEGKNFCLVCGAKLEAQNTAAPETVITRRILSKGETVFAVVIAFLSILFADFFLWGCCGIAATIVMQLAHCLLIGYLVISKKHYSAYAFILFVLGTVLALNFTLTSNDWYRFFTFMMLLVTYTTEIMEIAQLRTHPIGSFKSVGDFFRVVFVFTFGRLGRSFYALFHKRENSGKKAGVIGGVIVGLICAVPVLAIIIPLLVSSDGAFEGLVQSITFADFGEIVGSVIIGLILFIMVFSQIFAAAGETREIVDKESTRGIPQVFVVSFMSVISLTYVAYLFSQLAYFFDAFKGMLPTDFTFAEYARRGFFEMCAICVINLLIIFLTNLIVKKQNGKAPLAVRLISVFVALFSIVLVVTSLSKMTMYMNTYGLTVLRILTSLFMLFLAVVFIGVVFKMFVKKFPYMQVSLVCAALIVCATGLVGVDRAVAKYNIENYLNGNLATVDMNTIEGLNSDSIVPYVYKLIDDKDNVVSYRAKVLLNERYNKLVSEDNKASVVNNWRAYNVVDYNSAELLLKNHDAYAPEKSASLSTHPIFATADKTELPSLCIDGETYVYSEKTLNFNKESYDIEDLELPMGEDDYYITLSYVRFDDAKVAVNVDDVWYEFVKE